jgi:hypothetical protein
LGAQSRGACGEDGGEARKEVVTIRITARATAQVTQRAAKNREMITLPKKVSRRLRKRSKEANDGIP